MLPTGVKSLRPRGSAQSVYTVGKGEYSRGKEALATGNWAYPALWTHSPDPQSHLSQDRPSAGTVDSVQVQPSTVWKCGRPFVAHEAFHKLNHLCECCLTHGCNNLEHRRIVRLCEQLTWGQGFPDGASGKEPTCQCRKHKRHRFNPQVGKTLGGGHGNPLQYSCLENSMDRGAWQAAVHGVAKSQTGLKQLSTNIGTNNLSFNKDDQEDRQCPLGVLK